MAQILIKEKSLAGLEPTIANCWREWNEPWKGPDDNDAKKSYLFTRSFLSHRKDARQITEEFTRNALYAYQQPYYAAAAYVVQDCLVANIFGPRSGSYLHVIRAANLEMHKEKIEEAIDYLVDSNIFHHDVFRDYVKSKERIIQVNEPLDDNVEKLYPHLPGFLEVKMNI